LNKYCILDEDEIAMKYTGTKKGMMIYGFVPQNDIKLEYWSGCGSRIIVPSSEVRL
jgi:non-homologous end joining protein Ku